MDCELKTFCVLPWIHSFVNSNGAYQVCCLSEEYHQGIPDINGDFYNIQNRPSLTEVMNAPMMKELRLKMLKGEWSEVCTRCFETEKNGGSSRRNIENSAFKETISELVSKTQDNGEIDLSFKSLDYRLGNTCNLQCRMCSPFSSSRWIKDWNDIKGQNEQLTVELKEYYKEFSWPEGGYLLDELREKLDGVERIHFAGGEPLLSSQMSLILKHLITTGYAKRMVVSYNSNITVLPKEVLELWKHFKEIRILASVDGHGEVNEYIRYPSKWSVVNKNLLYLDEHARELNIGEIILSCTVQIYNVLYLKDLFDYLENFQNILPVLNLSNLYFPEYLSAQVLPAKAKEIASERLQEVLRDREERSIAHSYLVDNIKQTINFINEKDRTDLLEKFKKMNSNFDKKKNVKFSSVLPELNSYLINYYIDQVSLKSKQ